MAKSQTKYQWQRHNIKFTPAKRIKFIELYGETGVIYKCARACGVSADTVEDWRKKDEEFNQQFEQAYELYRNRLEAEALRRAVDGVPEPVYYKGEVVGHVQKYSDTLLIKMLHRHIAEFRDKATMDVNVKGGVLVVPGSSKDSKDWEEENRK